jgi:ATP-dependent DNA ligase
VGQGPLPPPAGSHPERTRFLAYRFGGVYGPLCESPGTKITPSQKPPSGSAWVHEIKHDGYWLIARRDGNRVRLYTRRGYDWSRWRATYNPSV